MQQPQSTALCLGICFYDVFEEYKGMLSVPRAYISRQSHKILPHMADIYVPSWVSFHTHPLPSLLKE